MVGGNKSGWHGVFKEGEKTKLSPTHSKNIFKKKKKKKKPPQPLTTEPPSSTWTTEPMFWLGMTSRMIGIEVLRIWDPHFVTLPSKPRIYGRNWKSWWLPTIEGARVSNCFVPADFFPILYPLIGFSPYNEKEGNTVSYISKERVILTLIALSSNLSRRLKRSSVLFLWSLKTLTFQKIGVIMQLAKDILDLRIMNTTVIFFFLVTTSVTRLKTLTTRCFVRRGVMLKLFIGRLVEKGKELVSYGYLRLFPILVH